LFSDIYSLFYTPSPRSFPVLRLFCFPYAGGASNIYCAKAARLSCPISVFHGVDDIDIEPMQLKAWSQLTQQGIKLSIFDGDHFFINQQREKVMKEVKAILLAISSERNTTSLLTVGKGKVIAK
jgi:surfactin synthase thioesterase subunit